MTFTDVAKAWADDCDQLWGNCPFCQADADENDRLTEHEDGCLWPTLDGFFKGEGARIAGVLDVDQIDHARRMARHIDLGPDAPPLREILDSHEALRREVARLAESTPETTRVKCDGNHGGPRCADPECWNDETPETPVLTPESIETRRLLADNGRRVLPGLALSHDQLCDSHEELRRQVAALTEALAGMVRWQPIETADKDEAEKRPILVFDPTYVEPVVGAYWDGEVEHEGGQCWRAADAYADQLKPVMWAKWPKAPKVREAIDAAKEK